MTLAKEMVEKVLDRCANDGHALIKAGAFNYLPPEFLKKNTKFYESDGSCKGSIVNNEGYLLPSVEGVYSLDLLWSVAHDIGANTEIAQQKLGRGFQAQALTNAIQEKIKDME